MATPLTKMQRRQDVGIVVEIAGYGTRWYLGPTAPPVDEEYTARPGLVSYIPDTQKLDTLSGIVEGGGCDIEIAVDAPGARALLAKVAPRTFTLAEEVPRAAGAVDVVVEESIAGMPAAGVIWVGQEAMRYGSHDGASTFAVAERGYYGSKVQRHRVSPSGRRPQVHSACVRWLGRAAKVRIYRISRGQWLGGHVEVAGTIEGSPQEQGGRIEIRIDPWAAILGREVGGGGLATTLHDLHAFDGESELYVARSEVWDTGKAYLGRVPAFEAGATDDVIPGVGFRAHQEIFDLTDADRVGLVQVGAFGSQDPSTVLAYAGDADSGDLEIDDDRAFGPGTVVQNLHTQLRQRALVATPGTPEALSIQDVVRRINTAWRPGTTQGASGAWADATITFMDPAAGGGASIRFRLNSDAQAGQLRQLIDLSDPRALYVGVDMAAPDDPVVAVPSPRGPAWPEARWLDLASKKSTGGPDVVKIRNICHAWWQTGSKWVWVRDNVFAPPDPTRELWVRAEFKDLDGEQRETHVHVVDIYPADDVFPGLDGYLLELHEDDRWLSRSIAWPQGAEAPVIRQSADWRLKPPTTVLLALLLSGDGDGWNDADHDYLPFGLDLDGTVVDVGTFEDFPIISGPAERVTVSIRDAVQVDEFAGPLLRTLGGAITDKVDQITGERRLALIPLGPARPSDVVLTITRGMWAQAPRPASQSDDAIVNVLEVHTDFDDVEGKFTKRTFVHDEPSIGEHGSRPRKEELRGVRLTSDTPGDRRDELVPWAVEVFTLKGSSVSLVRGRIPYADAVVLYCGATVQLEDAPATGADGLEGITGPARIVEITPDPTTGLTEIVASHNPLDAEVGGWAPSLDVVEVIDAVTVRVADNAYSATTNAAGAVQKDIDFFVVTDPVRTIPIDAAAGTTTTIVDIDGDEVTFDDAHGFDSVQLGRVRGVAWPSTSDNLGGDYAHLARANGTLGGSAPPKRYG
jgi:hypothetical protein